MRRLPIADAAEKLEEEERLDPVIEAIAPRVRRAPRAILDVLHGEPIGHAAHPAAVLVPAGAWISATVLDLLPGTRGAARALVAAGLVTALPATASGLADWSSLHRRAQRVGLVHAAANTVAWGLYAASWVRRGHGGGKLLAGAGLAVLGISGYLGGHLAYKQGARVEIEPENAAAAVAPDAED